MLDIDPGLDSKLRTLYEHIEAQSVSHALTGFEAPHPRPRRRTLNLMAAVVGRRRPRGGNRRVCDRAGPSRT